ncbi:MAG: hypothetical protein JNL44_09705 [Gemmatimonadetes bacterium]|nr:hypothetical protein [Gemmatimonadota bacterium]
MRPLRRAAAGLCALLAVACGDGVSGLIDQVRTINSTATTTDLYSGSRGLVIDTRPIFERGFRPAKVEVSFPDHPRLNRTVDVDPVTNLAIVKFENDSLTADERTALNEQVNVRTVVVEGGATRVVRADVTELRSVDASNRTEVVDNAALGSAPRPAIMLEKNTPYLLVLEGFETLPTISEGAVIRLDRFGRFFGTSPAGDTLADGSPRHRQGFFFERDSAGGNWYRIRNGAAPPFGTYLGEVPSGFAGIFNLLVVGGSNTGIPAQFEVVPDSTGGSVRLRERNSNRYVRVAPLGTHQLVTQENIAGTRIWLRASDTEWSIRSLGTAYNQPIIPPAQVAFASTSTIINCSQATVNESLGRAQSRTTTRTSSKSRSNSFTSQSNYSYTHSNNFEVKLQFKEGVGISPSFGAEFSQTFTGGWSNDWTNSYTTTSMHDSTTTNSDVVSETVEITRTRDVTVGPGKAVTAADLVRTIANVTVAWTQRNRIEGRNPRTGASMTGPEIVSQMEFARHRGLVTRVGATFVEFTERGSTTVNNFYDTESTVRDIPNACK